MTLAFTVGTVRSTPCMFAEREPNNIPKMTPSLEAVVPLGAMLIPLGGSEMDGRMFRVVANVDGDAAVPPLKVAVGAGFVPPFEDRDVAFDGFDGAAEVPPV